MNNFDLKAAYQRSKAEANVPEGNGAPSPLDAPRGLLPVPESVERLLDAEPLPMSEKARKFYRDSFVLQYYVGGQYVLYRTVPEGMELLAVGIDEVGKVPRGSPGDPGYMAVGADVDEWGWDQ